MEKSLIVRFRVEDVDLPDLLLSLFSAVGGLPESEDCLAVIEDFYVPVSNTYFDNLGLPPERKCTRDPKSGWPVND